MWPIVAASFAAITAKWGFVFVYGTVAAIQWHVRCHELAVTHVFFVHPLCASPDQRLGLNSLGADQRLYLDSHGFPLSIFMRWSSRASHAAKAHLIHDGAFAIVEALVPRLN